MFPWKRNGLEVASQIAHISAIHRRHTKNSEILDMSATACHCSVLSPFKNEGFRTVIVLTLIARLNIALYEAIARQDVILLIFPPNAELEKRSSWTHLLSCLHQQKSNFLSFRLYASGRCRRCQLAMGKPVDTSGWGTEILKQLPNLFVLKISDDWQLAGCSLRGVIILFNK